MKISAKTRYALAASVRMAQLYQAKECVSLISLSDSLKISKIYLEHIFSLLKRAGVVTSIKGAQGGYLLARPPEEINAYHIMSAIEISLFSGNEKTVEKSAPNIEKAIQNVLFMPLDKSIKAALSDVTLAKLVQEAEKHNTNYMYYL